MRHKVSESLTFVSAPHIRPPKMEALNFNNAKFHHFDDAKGQT